ncbi:MAG: YihY/virulence factor BrkB family protein [Myxococcales bacterium]|jgi:YihY family inner membrane protein
MNAELAAFRHILAHPGQFGMQVLRAFRNHQGLLLAGAVAYYTLLSIVPLFSLLLVGLSHVVDEAELIAMTRGLLELLVASQADALIAQLRTFLEHRAVIGGFGFLVMLFFSSLAFSVLENCMSVIFFHRAGVRHRHFLVSAALPYLFIALLGFGVLAVTVIGTMVQATDFHLGEPASVGLYLLGVVGLMLMLTAIYLVIPVGKISFKHALVGGVTAGLLWEIVRHIMVWYFRTLSMVNVIYGSFATTVLALLSLELASIILLLGAQVIAEFERLIARMVAERKTA